MNDIVHALEQLPLGDDSTAVVEKHHGGVLVEL
jgi:hypothetical protein